MKGHIRYTEPLPIREKIGDSILSENLDAFHLTHFPVSAATADRDIVEAVIDSLPRTRRIIQRPVWLKDYVP